MFNTNKVRLKAKPNQRVITRQNGQCWIEKRIHTEDRKSREEGIYEPCKRPARDGFLTCTWHAAKWEEKAQEMKHE